MDGMKELMLGNQAVAQGLYQAGCRVVSSYPGTPSTEITEFASTYPEIYTEWAPNEKVAYEAAMGASIAGARAFCAMKHVGLNVAADPLFTTAYTGVGGGMVAAVADDPGMHSSQNEQDSRRYAVAAKLPMLEPADSQECADYTEAAFRLSEEYDTPVLLRLSTRVSHSQSLVETKARQELPLKPYQKDPGKYVMMPANAKKRRVAVEGRMAALEKLAETGSFNRVEPGSDRRIGVITAGICYQYVREAMPDAPILKLGLLNPLPVKLILDFTETVDEVIVAEELDPVIESHCAAIGVPVRGKELFGAIGELSQNLVRQKLTGREPEAGCQYPGELPVRPPILCPGCPHRGLFYTLHKLGLTVFGDIGCYTLGSLPPLSAMDVTLCMGASVSGLHGFLKARPEEAGKAVGVIGDSTFVHSGITGLIDTVYNKGLSTVIILDNSITGMTGHQENPTTGRDIHRQPAPQLSIEGVCQAVGVEKVLIADPGDLPAMEAAVREALAWEGAAVVIARRPCALLKGVKRLPPVRVEESVCIGCRACMRIGCPAISFHGGRAHIDETLCVGCGLCVGLCPKDAIKEGAK